MTESLENGRLSPSFTYADKACGMISAEALRELLTRIPSRADVTSARGEESDDCLSNNQLISCRGLELTSLAAGRAPLVARIESILAVLAGRWVAGRQLQVECHPGDVVLLKERSDWRSLASDTPGLAARESRLELVAVAGNCWSKDESVPSDTLPIARIDAQGRFAPWFWPRLARISSHPLSMAAAEALLRLMKSGTVPASRGLQYRLLDADRTTWGELLPVLIDWGEQRFQGRVSAIDWPKRVDGPTSDAAWVRAVHCLVTGSEMVDSLFPLRLQRTGDTAPRELLSEIAPHRIIESRGTGETRVGSAYQLEYEILPSDRARFTGKSAILYVVVQPHEASHGVSRCHVVVRQRGAPDRFKEFTPRGEPLLLADVAVDRPFMIELQNGRMMGTALYRGDT